MKAVPEGSFVLQARPLVLSKFVVMAVGTTASDTGFDELQRTDWVNPVFSQIKQANNKICFNSLSKFSTFSTASTTKKQGVNTLTNVHRRFNPRIWVLENEWRPHTMKKGFAQDQGKALKTQKHQENCLIALKSSR